MTDRFRITLGQLNPVMGDIAGNAETAYQAWLVGKQAEADLVALPEMFLVGYNAQDLVRKPAFHLDAMRQVEALAARCADGPALAIGGPYVTEGKLFNAYFICRGGHVVSRVLKHNLPNETVFDEVRIFDSGPLAGPVGFEDTRIGFPICEDSWHPEVAETLAETGAEFLLVPNGSPYYRGKLETRINHMVARVVETDLPLIYLNMVGGQDDQVFDGASFGLNPGGALAFLLPPFDTVLHTITLTRDTDSEAGGWRIEAGEKAEQPDTCEQDYRAMVEVCGITSARRGSPKRYWVCLGGWTARWWRPWPRMRWGPRMCDA